MLRTIGIGLAAVALLTPPRIQSPGAGEPAAGLRELFVAAQGAPAAVCALAARGVLASGWGSAAEPPMPLLPRPAAWRARGNHGESLDAADVRYILDQLATGDACVRELAVRLVAEQEDAQVAPGLVERLTAPDSALRGVAAYGLGMGGVRAAVVPLLRGLEDGAAGVRANVVWALGRIGDGRAVRAVTGRLADRAPIVREAAAGALGQLDSSSAVPALLRVLREDDVAAVRRTAAWALGQLSAEEAAGALATALRGDRDAAVREMCAWALGSIAAPAAGPALLAAARGDSDESVRETAVWALGQRGHEDDGTDLGQVLAAERSVRVRRTAAWALGQMNLRAAPKALLEALGDDDRDLRLKAAWALSEIGDAAAVPALRAALGREQDPRARQAEVRALIHSGERAERLTELLQSADPQVREAAIRGIAGRGGVDPWPWPQPRPRPFP